MTKTIRKTYPRDFSIGVLVIIFALIFFLAGQLFAKNQPDTVPNMYLAYFLVSTAVIVMVLILWEEILFPVTIKPEGDGLIFRNHRTKLKIQGLFYLAIPAIVAFLYFTYEISVFRFFTWAGIVLALPIAGRLVSGINNYNDFLTLHGTYISYKNNEKEGTYNVSDISKIEMMKDDAKDLHKIKLHLKAGEPLIIDLDEMELEDYLAAIEDYILEHYKTLL